MFCPYVPEIEKASRTESSPGSGAEKFFWKGLSKICGNPFRGGGGDCGVVALLRHNGEADGGVRARFAVRPSDGKFVGLLAEHSCKRPGAGCVPDPVGL